MGTSGDPVEGPAEARSLRAAVGAWLTAVAVSTGVTFWLLDALRVSSWWPFNQVHTGQDLFDLMRSTVGFTGLFGATAAIAIAIRRQQSTERSVQIGAEAQRVAAMAQEITANAYALDVARNSHEQVRDLRLRFDSAASQLGDDAAPVRLAGVVALSSLADDWLQRGAAHEAQVCIDVLCAYIRTSREASSSIESVADVEVRQTIVRTITLRLQPGEPSERDWRGCSFDFSGATFEGIFRFDGAEFKGGVVRFDGARFVSGETSFDSVRFVGGEVSFDRAEFLGALVRFDGAAFSGHVVRFAEAVFAGGHVSFLLCGMHGLVSFVRSRFSGSMVRFEAASFSGGEVTFVFAEFSDGALMFVDAEFAGGSLSFFGARFAGGQLRFRGSKVDRTPAEVPDGKVDFLRAEFTGGVVHFDRADLLRSRIVGPWEGPAPARWP